MRRVYFGVAALWGFLIGAGALVLALTATGHTVELRPSALALALPGAGLALIGGLVSAAAYREARRRLSS